MHSAPYRHSDSERGSVLVYALMVIAFLAGLASYLATFSDPVIYRNQDTQRIIKAEYTAEAVANIVGAMCSKDIEKDTNLQQEIKNCSSTTAGTSCDESSIKSKIAGFINKYRYVQIHNAPENLVGTAHLTNTLGSAAITIGKDTNGNTRFTATPTYEVGYSLYEKSTQTVKLVIEMP